MKFNQTRTARRAEADADDNIIYRRSDPSRSKHAKAEALRRSEVRRQKVAGA